jgi:hypothetical protein
MDGTIRSRIPVLFLYRGVKKERRGEMSGGKGGEKRRDDEMDGRG